MLRHWVDYLDISDPCKWPNCSIDGETCQNRTCQCGTSGKTCKLAISSNKADSCNVESNQCECEAGPSCKDGQRCLAGSGCGKGKTLLTRI